MHECCEVLHKLHNPFLVTEEVGGEECHNKTVQTELRAAIGQGAKKWQLHKLTMVLHNNLRNVIRHDTYLFPEIKTSVPSQHTHNWNL
jgi:hypothetical protein